MITPREQNYIQSCLPACLAMLCGVKMTKEQEGRILLKGLEKHYDEYHTGMLSEFDKVYKPKLNIYVEYRAFTNYLKNKLFDHKNLVIKNEKTNLANIKKHLKGGPILIYLDAKYLEYNYPAEHAGHFIVVEQISGNTVAIVDSWEGRRKNIKQASLLKAIKSLKVQFKYSPIIITL